MRRRNQLKHYYICSPWDSRFIVGTRRFEHNLLKALGELIEKKRGGNSSESPCPEKFRVHIVVPRDVRRELDFRNISVHRVGKLYIRRLKLDLTKFWQQIVFPFYVILHRGIGVDLTLNFPGCATRIYAIHDCIAETFYKGEKDDAKRNYLNCLQSVMRKIKRKDNERYRVITVSQFSADEIVRCYSIKRELISIVGNGWEHVHSVKEDGNIFKKLAMRPDDRYVLFIGKQGDHKNTDMVYRTARINPEYRFVIAGFSARNRVNRDGNVIETGYVSDNEVKALLANCTALIQPSFCEGFGIVPLEALSLEKPVLLSELPPFKEIYGESAHYFDPDSDGIHIDEILKEKTAPPDAVLQRYTWANAAQKMWDILNE